MKDNILNARLIQAFLVQNLFCNQPFLILINIYTLLLQNFSLCVLTFSVVGWKLGQVYLLTFYKIKIKKVLSEINCGSQINFTSRTMQRKEFLFQKWKETSLTLSPFYPIFFEGFVSNASLVTANVVFIRHSPSRQIY